MSNEIEIRVTSKNNTKPGFEQAKRDSAALEKQAKDLGAEFQRAGQTTDIFGQKLRTSGGFTEFLSGKINKLREDTRQLALEFNRTGDAKIGSKLFDADKELHDLEAFGKKFAKTLGDDGHQAGQEFSKNLSASIQGAESTPGLGPALTATLVGAAVAASPAIAAALNGALLAGVGLGGVALGIVGQVNDPKVRSAFADMANDFMTELGRDTAPFKAPLIAAARTIGDAIKHELDSIDFGQLADLIGPLSRGLSGLVANLDLGRLFADAVPLVQELAKYLPEVGRALGDVFHQMAGSEGAKEGLRALLAAVVGMIEFFGALITTLSDIWAWFVRVGDVMSRFAEDVTETASPLHRLAESVHDVTHWLRFGSDSAEQLGRSLHGAGGAAALTADDMAGLASKIDEVIVTQDRLAGKLADRLLDTLLGTAHATLGFEEALTRASQSIEENGRTLDIHTEKGQRNQEAIYAMVEANKRVFDQNIATGMSMDQATLKWDQNTQRIYAWGRQVGLSKGQIDGLIGSMNSVPDKVDANIAMYGLTAAIDNMSELLALIYHVQNNRIIDIEVRNRINAPGSFGHASGGVWGGATAVAERGRELARLPGGQMAVLPPGSMVYSNPDTERMLSGASSRAPDSGVRTMVLGPGLDTAFGSYVQHMIATGQITIN